MKTKSRVNAFAATLVLALFGVATGQDLPKTKGGPAIPAPLLIKIIRHEDQRLWDSELTALLADQAPTVRFRAALAAGRIGDPRAVPLLADMLLTDRDNNVREMAAFALGEIESPGGFFALLSVLKNPTSPARARAVEAVGKIIAAMPAAAAGNGQSGAQAAPDDR